ncbi:uncharacterized protein [Polyergus mexicanus]|uniref:uncharacterized protein n=1 Tax=Polyergus mexicanus TaxID=615972 RepID=UPI0038B59CE6
MHKALQANVNRGRPFLDLLINQAREMDAGILFVSEPNYIPNSDNWYENLDKGAAVFVDPMRVGMRNYLAKKGFRFVAVHCGPYLFVSIYISPRLNAREFNSILDELSAFLADRTDKIIIAGDFNAKASLWSSESTDRRGLLFSRWTAGKDLRIKNWSNVPTEWCVWEDLESLSDHLIVEFDIHTDRPIMQSGKAFPRKWNTKKFDEDTFQATLIWRDNGPDPEDHEDVSKMITWSNQTMEEACDVASVRDGPGKPRKQAYWWQKSVRVLQTNCIRVRRLWQKAKKRKHCRDVIAALGLDYKAKRRELHMEINRLKAASWQELLDVVLPERYGSWNRLPEGI